MEYRRVYLIGFMGAGKTTVGRQLAKKLRWKFFDLDQEIEKLEKKRISEIFRESGEPHFRELERRHLKELSSVERAVIALGGGAFLDPQNRELAEKTGLTIWLKVSFAKVADRVKIDGTRPKFADKDQAERLYRSREPFYANAKIHISADAGSPEAVVNEIMGVIQKS
jgi:shikimate kinase